MKKALVKSTLVLAVFVLVSAVLIGLTNSATQGQLAERRAQATAEALDALLPGSFHAEQTNLSIAGSSLTRVYRSYNSEGALLGHVFFASPTGYAGAINMMVALDTRGYIQGVEILNHSETPGIGSVIAESWFGEAFVGRIGLLAATRRATGPQEIDAVAGATISVNAVTRGVNDATRYLGLENAGGPMTAAVPPLYPVVADLLPGTRFTEFVHVNDFSVEWMAAGYSEVGDLVGYVFFTSPRGFGGPIEMALVLDARGSIQDLRIIDHLETWSFGGRVLDTPEFSRQFVGHDFTQRIERAGVDTVSFATISIDSVIRGINDAMHYFNRNHRDDIVEYIQEHIEVYG